MSDFQSKDFSLSEIKRFDVVLFKKDGKKTVKRCIGKAGESFQIINDVIFINSLPIESYNYQSPNPNDIKIETSLSVFELIRKNKWTLKNFGEFMIPYKDFKIKLNKSNLQKYQDLITKYEAKIEIKNDSIYINNVLSNEYVFKNDYYFLIGDNNKNSIDSRFYGPVPRNYIYGKYILKI